jgi:hypothetical protein
MRRDVKQLNLAGVVGQELPQAALVIAIRLLLKTHHPGRHRQDAVLPHLADGFPVGRGRDALADQFKRSLVGAFHA